MAKTPLKHPALAAGILLFALLLCFTAASGQGKNQLPYKNPKLPVEERVQDLLSRMTLQEKVAQMLCIWTKKPALLLDEVGNFSAEKAQDHFPNGLGQIARPSESLNRDLLQNRGPREMAEFTNAIQRYFVEQTRLGIPVVFHEECLHGHAAKDGTSFPQPIAMASSWDTDLIQQIFSLTAKEARSRGAHQALTPVVDVARDPRWGRFEETFGEDPYLVGEMGVAAVRGFQGEDPFIDKEHMLATLKHMTGHGQPEAGNNIAPAHVPERMLREIFLPPFQKAIQEAGAWSVMASYNEIDGIPSHANPFLLQDVLRKEWGFEGYVVADYSGIPDLISRHHVAKDSVEAALLALTSGVDIELPDASFYPLIENAANEQLIEMSVIDSAVARLLRGKFMLGIFEEPYVDPDYAEKFVGSEKNGELAREAAQKSIVMLRNENNFLPLDPKAYKTIAVIGPNANKELLGGYSDVPPYHITLLEGIEQHVDDNIAVVYAEGCRITETGSWYADPVVLPDPKEDLKRIEHAVRVAERSDLVIMALGGNELTSREAWSETHLGDRTDIQLVGRQNELLKRILQTGKPVVLTLFNGRPLAIDYATKHVPTILECWYLGQESGNAVADVIFGEVNPSGKLPCTIPRSVGHIPAFYNHKPSARRGYLFDDASPLFPFGFGLSFTSFEYSDIEVYPARIPTGSRAEVTIEVTNTGDYRGEEIVQLYIRDRVSSVTRPVKELKGFQKIDLKPGQSREVKFILSPNDLKFWNREMEFVLEPGFFDIMVGTSSASFETAELEVVK